ncbi:MAG: TSUP family transporter, partial [Methylophilaceae bacterium]
MKFRNLDLSENPVNTEHQALGLPPLENTAKHPVLSLAMWSAMLMLIIATAYLTTKLFSQNGLAGSANIVLSVLQSEVFWLAVAVGLIAQTVDGALGMAYGITSTTFLLATGVSPAVASASVHIAEVFTTGVSGISHVKLGNVN